MRHPTDICGKQLCWHNHVAEAAHAIFGMNPFPYTPIAECVHCYRRKAREWFTDARRVAYAANH